MALLVEPTGVYLKLIVHEIINVPYDAYDGYRLTFPQFEEVCRLTLVKLALSTCHLKLVRPKGDDIEVVLMDLANLTVHTHVHSNVSCIGRDFVRISEV